MPRPNPYRYALNAYIDISARDVLPELRAAVGVGSDAALCRVALALVAHRFGLDIPVEPGDVGALRALLLAPAGGQPVAIATRTSSRLPPEVPLGMTDEELPHELPATVPPSSEVPGRG